LRTRPQGDAAIFVNEQDVRIINTRRKHRRNPESPKRAEKRAA
jgi:hypothetical protein